MTILCEQLEAEGEPKEVLKAYSSTSLKLCGNSTTLARWDAKLGASLLRTPVAASLRSLNPDGGVVMLLDIVVEKVFNIGFTEMTSAGTRLAPTNAAEERDAGAKWEVRANFETRCHGIS
jgi:breast cancer 2 susceptibility protein